ncbi:MAG TPA: hypothetical protein VLT16_12405 [Candidatus Limnocylindrales bacterium]|nr:hypothetical protein [Candidatus Limnocylindrales bacterium]
MTDTAIREADHAFSKQVSTQVERITGELGRLEVLLRAGMVDRRVLEVFRQTVDRVRTTGWQVQSWLDGDERALATIVTEERIRVATRLAVILAAEKSVVQNEVTGIHDLKEAIHKLDKALASNA